MLRRLLPLTLVALAVGSPPSTSGAAPRPASVTRGSLDTFADAIVDLLRPQLGGAADLDVAVVIGGAWPRLGDDLAALLVARLRSAGVRSVARGAGDEAWARAAGFERLVRLDLDVAGGRLRGTGALVALSGSPWTPPAETRSHVYVETPLDAELRAYLPAIAAPPGRWQARGIPVGDVDVLALDVGDVDGDGRAEVVGATAAEVVVWAWDGAKLAERRRFAIGARPAAQRPRADVATVVVEDGVIVAHASPFADGVRRAGEQQTVAHGFAFPGIGARCELVAGVDWFAATACAPGAGAAGLPERFWSVAGSRGSGHAARAVIDAAGTLSVQLAAPVASPSPASLPVAPLTVHGVGAQLALALLDRGEMLVTTEPVQPGEADAIVIRALTAGLPVVHRVDRLPGGVRALAAGDIDGDGRAELIAAVRDRAAGKTELWIVN